MHTGTLPLQRALCIGGQADCRIVSALVLADVPRG